MEDPTLIELAASVGELLKKHELKLATAESCTGGMIGSVITANSGSSDYYLGGIISYSDEIKEKLLGVDPKTLEDDGAVSENAAFEMSVGASIGFGSEVAVSTTGFAGPTGGTPEKPVGTVFVGVLIGSDSYVEAFLFDGDRNTVREATVRAALSMIIETLKARGLE